MSDYKLKKDGVIRQADGAHIPADLGNMDWLRYQDWLKTAGNVPDPVDPAPVAKLDRTEQLIAKLKEKAIITDADIPKPQAATALPDV